MFIVDFDDTLFDTQGFKEAKCEALKAYGISDAVYWETYQQARNNDAGEFVYSDEMHARYLSQHGVSEKDAVAALADATNRLPEFLFPDTMSFLKYLKGKGQAMILLSLGEPAFQEQKVKGAGVDQFFDRMFMVTANKQDVVKEVIEHHSPESVLFINDKVAESVAIKEANPEIQVVLKQSPVIERKAYEASGFAFFDSLTKIQQYVEQK